MLCLRLNWFSISGTSFTVITLKQKSEGVPRFLCDTQGVVFVVVETVVLVDVAVEVLVTVRVAVDVILFFAHVGNFASSSFFPPLC
mmetsp:Transcript_62895/g.180330  ORF Transcript_62895/g.180330 Transcript_62895/m.180330 type:complete len:86 (-) Transcript_62895:528-785(-)